MVLIFNTLYLDEIIFCYISGGVIGLCLKGLYHTSSDDSYKLIEWLEIQRAIKVDKVFAYVIDIHKNMWKVR